MTGLEKLIEWWDNLDSKDLSEYMNYGKGEVFVMDKARYLLQEERATADEGLWEELNRIMAQDILSPMAKLARINEALSRHRPTTKEAK